ncbi:hypothetical protein [Mycobacterium sp. MMS18-G62]
MDDNSLLYTLVADKQLDLELDKRVVHRFAPTIVEPKGLAELEAPLFKEGSIVLFIAVPDRSKVVAKFLKSVAAADLGAIDEFDAMMRAAQSAGLHMARDTSVFETPHLVDVSYGTEKLARGVAPSMVGGVAVAIAIWNGGELDHAKFSVADYVTDAKAKPVSVHAVLTRPRLSKLEQAVLKAVPADIDDLRVEGPSLAWAAVAREGDHVPADHRGPVVGHQEAQGPVLGQEVQQDAWTNQVERIQQQQDNTQVQQEQVQVQQADHQYQDQYQNQQDNNQHVQQQQLQEQYFTKGMAQIQQQQDGQTRQEQQQKVQTRQGKQEQQHQGSTESWLDDRQGASLNPFDRDAYLNTIAATDFDALDTTQSAHALLRIRSEFVRRGMG